MKKLLSNDTYMNIIATDYYDISYAGKLVSESFGSSYIVIKPSIKSGVCIAVRTDTIKHVYEMHGNLLYSGAESLKTDYEELVDIEKKIIIRTTSGVSFTGIHYTIS